MKKFFDQICAEALEHLRKAVIVAVAAMLAVLPSEGALAQTVTQQPTYININTVTDLGNGPLDVLVIQGNAWLFTSQSNGVGSTSGSSTSLTLTATPTTPPCVGCAITGPGITAGDTVASYNGGTGIGLSTARTVPAGSALAWGAACPAYNGLLPTPNIQLQQSNSALPLYTYARLCGFSNNGPGATVLDFAIGSH